MTTQPEALRLADEIEGDYEPDLLYEIGADEIAAELRLRRLAAENDALGLHLSERMKDLARIEAQRDALLEALKAVVAFTGAHGGPYVQARAAIAKAEEKT